MRTTWHVSLFALCLTYASGCSTAAKAPEPAASPVASPTAAAPAAAKKTEAAADAAIHCQQGKDSRTLQIVERKPGCALEYTRDQSKKEIASSTKARTHCEEVRDRMKKNLEAAGFKCQ
jgi:hypothetical protein